MMEKAKGAPQSKKLPISRRGERYTRAKRSMAGAAPQRGGDRGERFHIGSNSCRGCALRSQRIGAGEAQPYLQSPHFRREIRTAAFHRRGRSIGHEVRIFDLVRELGNEGPVIAGMRVKQIRSVGTSDYTNLSGPATSYATFTMENGDKFFVRTSIVSHAVEFGNARKGATNLTSGPIYGGTGKLAGLRGTVRNASEFDPKSGANESRFDIEYWIEGSGH
jgi:hypothetical protein